VSRATDERNFQKAVLKQQAIIDTLFATAVGMVRSHEPDLTNVDVPRLCVSAGCRFLEKLLETQHAALTGQKPLSDDEKADLRRTIVIAAVDLKATLMEAMTIADKLAEFSDRMDAPTPAKDVQ
jgi:hypothetical protein